MGLDIAFDRGAAIKAGIKIKMIPVNGSYNKDDDPSYIEWCKSEEECIQVPGMDHWVANDSNGDDIIVRANPWGLTYHPLIKWLEVNNIKWSEF